MITSFLRQIDGIRYFHALFMISQLPIQSQTFFTDIDVDVPCFIKPVGVPE